MPSTFALQDHVGLDLHRAKGRGRIRREVWTTGPGGENDDPTLFQVPDRPPPNEGLGDGAHLDGRHHARDHAMLFERILQRRALMTVASMPM